MSITLQTILDNKQVRFHIKRDLSIYRKTQQSYTHTPTQPTLMHNSII